jgi:glyoxylase-like metal-dependent hydrolase (beta-lactamase superfamily II)
MEITRVTFGETNCYLLRGAEGVILIDAGPAGADSAIMVGAASNDIRPEEVKLILITHGHFDHYGAAKAIQEWCGAPVAAHRDAPIESQNRCNALPPAQTVRGSIVRWLYLLLSPLVPFSPLEADVLLEDGDSVEEYGVDAELVSVPGHSPDSLAVVTAEGGAFVGDLFVNYTVPSQPLYLWQRDVWQESYERIRELGPRMVYVGHGEPFGGEKLSHIYPARYQLRWWVR